MGNHANTSLNVDSTFRIAVGKQEITTTPFFEQALWNESENGYLIIYDKSFDVN
jgi:hypothetical protein